MEKDKLIQQALKDYEELQQITKETDLSLEELCDKLGGHNLSDDLFDVNFKSICATVVTKNGQLALLDSIEVWDDEICECYDFDFRVSKHKESQL